MNRQQIVRNFIYIATTYLTFYGFLGTCMRNGLSVSLVIYSMAFYIALFKWRFHRSHYKGKIDLDITIYCLIDLFLCYLLLTKKLDFSLVISMYTVMVTIGMIGIHIILSKWKRFNISYDR